MRLALVVSLWVGASASPAESQCPTGVKSLIGRSFEIDFVSDAADHTYTIVVGSHMSQTDKTEGTTRSLGKFSGISNGVHHYAAGDACEFVDRSADVAFRCGATDDVVSAEEPSACEFSFVIETPLCCAAKRKLDDDNDYEGAPLHPPPPPSPPPPPPSPPPPSPPPFPPPMPPPSPPPSPPPPSPPPSPPPPSPPPPSPPPS